MRNKIKQLLREALGVPQNILEVSEEIYNTLLSELKHTPNEDSGEYEISFERDFEISDLFFTEVIIKLSCHPQENFEKIVLIGGQVQFQSSIHPFEPIMKASKSQSFSVKIDFAVSEDNDISEIVGFVKNNKSLLMGLFSHELKHFYDEYKKPFTQFKERSDYSTYSGTRFGIPPIDKFLHYCYFITQIENLVRPTEIASLIKTNNITKNKFLEFLQNEKVFMMLQEIKSFSIDKFKEELKEYESLINDVFESVNETPPDNLDKKIDRFLEIFFLTITNARIESLQSLVFHNPISQFMGVTKNTLYLQEFIKKLTRFKNANDFLEYEQKRFKFVTNKLIRKISKLFDMAQTNESINDWELYHRIKKTKISEFVTKSKYFKTKK